MAADFKFASFDLFKPRKRPVHELKWPIPEAHFCAQVKDAEEMVAKIKKARGLFLGGGEFLDVVHAKEFGQGVFAYFIVRTDKRTQNEQLLFEGYMLEDEEKLGVDLAVGPQMMEDLQNLGYQQALAREVVVWNFKMPLYSVLVYSISEFGSFVEVVLPASKLERSREKTQKLALDFFELLGVKKEEVIPTDTITLQLVSSTQKGGK